VKQVNNEPMEELTELEEKKSKTFVVRIIRYIAIIFSAFFLYTAFAGPYISIIQRSIHVCGGILIWAMIDLAKKNVKLHIKIIDVLIIIIVLFSGIYLVLEGKTILMPNFEMTTPLYIMATLLILCVLEAARRTIGLAIPLLSLIIIAYALFGELITGSFGHSGFSFRTLVEVLIYSDRGIFGQVTGISATIIATFIIFGSILFATGGGKTFIDLASILTGNSYGGAAKLATVSSSLFGMISGSAGANVATTGAFTIPMMKKLGYGSDFAGAVEASASSGGQIMPPIMGAGAFIMADLIGIPYTKIAVAAIIPAFLFYYGVFFAIDCAAKLNSFAGVPKDQLPKAKEVLHYSHSLPVFVPIGVLIAFFSAGYTATACASYAIIAAVVLYLITDLKNFKQRILRLVNGLEDATKDMLTVITLIACSQILISIISLTGVGVKFTNLIVAFGGERIIIAGLCAMGATMVLGMGMPTVAAYILSASIIAPALVRIGVVPLAAHFFVFYYAIFAGLTPPVCGTIFIASAMAQSNWVKTAFISIRLSIGAFLIPFMMIINPAMLLIGSTTDIIRCTLTALIGITALASGFMGYFTKPLNMPIRVILCLAGIMLVDPMLMTDIIGITAAVIIFGWLFFTKKKNKNVTFIGSFR
jgi:TRAP transporter 4TM/12TM fusion protein